MSGAKNAIEFVAPVVRQPTLGEMPIDHVVMHGQQLHGRHAERVEVVDHRIGRETEVRPTLSLVDLGMLDRHPLHVALIDHRAIPRRARQSIVGPRERVVDDDALWRTRRAVIGRGLEIATRAPDLVPEERIAPANRVAHGLRIRIDQQLRRIEAMPFARRVWSVHAIAVQLTGTRVGQIAVPHLIAALGHRNAPHLVRIVRALEEAQIDARPVLREEREVDALTIPMCAERERLSRPNPHHRALRDSRSC